MYLMQEYLTEPAAQPLFGDAQWFAALLAFESALAESQAECGLIPETAARDIVRACEAVVPLDHAIFVTQARQSGALGVALVAPLKRWLSHNAPEALSWLHWGTTTQDAVDTAHAMLTRDALGALLAEIDALCEPLQAMARQHAATPMLARSLMQPAQVTSFGFKCAQTLASLRRSQAQLRELSSSALCVQLGGAVGNRASLGDAGVAVESAMARRLHLHAAGYAWHTQRDGWMRLGMEVAVCSGTLAKLAKDWALMSQFEVGEISEASRGSTSSAMPHKRNPVHCMQAIAQTQPVPHIASLLLSCMPQAHERALGEWQAEVAHWASLWQHTLAACRSLGLAAKGLQVHVGRMQANVDVLQQLVFSEGFVHVLSPCIGEVQAAALVAGMSEQALAQSTPLGALLLQWMEAAPSIEAAQKPPLRDALQQAADLNVAVRSSARACHELLKECAHCND